MPEKSALQKTKLSKDLIHQPHYDLLGMVFAFFAQSRPRLYVMCFAVHAGDATTGVAHFGGPIEVADLDLRRVVKWTCRFVGILWIYHGSGL